MLWKSFVRNGKIAIVRVAEDGREHDCGETPEVPEAFVIDWIAVHGKPGDGIITHTGRALQLMTQIGQA